MLGARPVDMLAWESFGEGWVTDVVKQLKLADARVIKAPYGELPDLTQVDTKTATWSSPGTAPPPACACRTPTGSRPTARGLTICDATSAAFAQKLDFAKLDVVTFSWQKVLGGEAATACSSSRPARSSGSRPTRPPGRCRRSSA
jgi:phosphoserine aminotransferase